MLSFVLPSLNGKKQIFYETAGSQNWLELKQNSWKLTKLKAICAKFLYNIATVNYRNEIFCVDLS